MSNIRVKYQTIVFDKTDIHLKTLKDNQQYEDKDDVAKNLGICSASWPIFGILWPSSQILAFHMLTYAIEGKRILEVGCGIGLSSLLLNHRKADITSTDYHPSVQSFLDHNANLNGDQNIPFERTGWSDNDDTLGKFDVIIGSDLLYEQTHIKQLSNFINNHSADRCEVIIIDPGRGNQNKFTKEMESFGFKSLKTKPQNVEYGEKPFKGFLLKYNK